MPEFKTGDKVRIRRDSGYYGQAYGIGIIEGYSNGWFIVEFKKERYSNSYHTEDLMYAHDDRLSK